MTAIRPKRKPSELDRLKTIQAVIDRDMKQGVAAARLGITPRQLRRLVLLT